MYEATLDAFVFYISCAQKLLSGSFFWIDTLQGRDQIHLDRLAMVANFAASINFLIVRQNPCSIKNQTFMKEGIHPKNYRLVVFKDMSNGHSFLSRSAAPSKETVKWEDGNEYPLVKLEISNTSHPFFTGKNVLVDTAGRIDKFKKKYEKKK